MDEKRPFPENVVFGGELSDEEFSSMFADDDGDAKEGRVRSDRSERLRNVTAPVSDSLSVLRNFPTVIAYIARQEFPEAKNNTDAIVAYMVCFCPEVADNNSLKYVLTPAQKELIDRHQNGSFSDMSSRMRTVAKKLDGQKSDIESMKMMLYYLVYNVFGFRECNPRPDMLGDVDYMEHNGRLMDFADITDKAAVDFRKRRDNRKGRPGNF